MITREWLSAKVATAESSSGETEAVQRMRTLLTGYAEHFAEARADVASPRLFESKRGLRHDECASFLRALDAQWITVDSQGFFTAPHVRAKVPQGRYSLLSRSGNRVSTNLEYIIQIGATAELVFDYGWPSEAIDFECDKFDALANDDNRPVLAMEAKARVTGPDSLEKLVQAWLAFQRNSDPDLDSNAGRKYRELLRLCEAGPVAVWLVADGARWSLTAIKDGARVLLFDGGPIARKALKQRLSLVTSAHESFAFDAKFHRPTSVAASGRCSQHGPGSCAQPAIISFQDRNNRWQSGCQRALGELVARGEILPPRESLPAV